MVHRTVLVFMEYGWRNGGENSFLSVVEAMPVEQFRFVVACPADTELANYLNSINVRHVAWNVFGIDQVRKSQLEVRAEIATLIRDVDPDLVHCNSLSTSRLAGPVCSQLEIPAIGYIRDILKMSKRARDDINQLNMIIAVSKATADFHTAEGIASDKLQVLFNGVDLQRFQRRLRTRYLYNELGLPDESKLIACIGQVGMRKGTEVVIEAFNELAKKFDNLVLLLIGIRNSSKAESIEFEQRCHEIGKLVESRRQLFWLGRRTDVADILNESTLLLHGARQEPLGRVLLEAMASGCPFVATRAGGTNEIVAGLDQQLMPVTCTIDDPGDMTDKAARILDSPSLQQAISKAFGELAIQRFDIIDCVRKLSALYISILPPNSCRPANQLTQ